MADPTASLTEATPESAQYESDISTGSQLPPAVDLAVAAYLVFVCKELRACAKNSSLYIGFCLGMLSAYANGVILISLLRQKGQLLHLDILMGFLAVSNGLLALITYPMVVVSLVSHQWKFGSAGCVVYAFITMFLGLSSVFDVPGIAYMFLITITAEPTAARKESNRGTCHGAIIGRIIAAIVAVSFVLCILPVVGVAEYGIAKHGTSCTIRWSAGSRVSVIYCALLMIIGFVVPVASTVIFYYRVVTYLHFLKLRYVNMDFARKWAEVQNDALMMMIAVGSCMVICWAPYAVVATWETFFDPLTLPVELEATASFTAKSSTAFTPLVHLGFTKKFRQWLRSPLLCFKSDEIIPSRLRLTTPVELSVSRLPSRSSFLYIPGSKDHSEPNTPV